MVSAVPYPMPLAPMSTSSPARMKSRVALGQLNAQDELVFREGRERLAGQNNLADENRDGEDTASARGKHRAFAGLLGDDAAVRLHCGQGAIGNVEIGFGLIELGLGADAALQQLSNAIEVDLGLIAPRLLRAGAQIQRLHLQCELLIGHQGDLGACGDRVAFLDCEGGDRAADPSPSDELMGRLNRRDDRLAGRCPARWGDCWRLGGAFDVRSAGVANSAHVRTGPAQWFSEGVATFALLLTIFGCVARAPAAVPYAVGLYITATYWFTASTSFANPAVTIASTSV